MERRLKRIEIILVIVTLLTLANLFYSRISQLFDSKDSTQEESTELKELPVDLNRESVDKIVYRIKTEFNKSDWDELHNIFGDYAKAQISTEDIVREFEKLKPAIGNIGTYAYSHYIYEGEGSGADWFELYYKCRFDNGKGRITISARTVDGISEITGINIKLEGF